MTIAVATPETFRANWIFILLWVLFGAVRIAVASGGFVRTCTVGFALQDYDLARILRVFRWAFSALCIELFGWALSMQPVSLGPYIARLDSVGVDFRFGSKKNTPD
jgi:hypothetical protein